MSTTFKLTRQKLVIPESYIEAQIFNYLKSAGIYCWKNDSVGIFDPKRKCYRKSNNPNRINGVSDILGVLPGGILLAVEVKSAKGVVSDDQKKFISAVISLGGIGFVARSVEEVRLKIIPILRTQTTKGDVSNDT